MFFIIIIFFKFKIKLLINCTLSLTEVRKTMRRMLALDKETYLHAFKSGTTKRYHIRVMIVGENFAEKTCLLSRLMNEKIDDVTSSTDRLDIHRRQCKVDVETGEWFFSGGKSFKNRLSFIFVDIKIKKTYIS